MLVFDSPVVEKPKRAIRPRSSRKDRALDILSEKYELKEKIGSGAEGQVFRALDNSGKDVAVKYIKVDSLNIYEVKKLIREIHILRELSKGPGSKFITRLLDVVTDQNYFQQK